MTYNFKPIDSAPKDGSQMLLLGLWENSALVGWWDSGNQPHPWQFLDWWNEIHGAREAAPTHWAPLPKGEAQ